MKKNLLRYFTSFALCAAVTVAAPPARAADHGDAPGVRLDTRLDINDVYVFKSPENPANTVLAITVSPIAGITGPLTFAPAPVNEYEIHVDNNADAKPDVVYKIAFRNPKADGSQNVTFTRVTGKKAVRIGAGSTESTVSLGGGTGKAFAGDVDDPFFFDLLAFRNSLKFSSTAPVNFFRGLNTLAIAIEVPTAELVGTTGGTKFGVYARTVKAGKQFDRMGRPAINTVLVKSANKDKFNKGKPLNDFATFSPDAIAIIQSLGSSAATAQQLAAVLFPDLLTYDSAATGGFLNGRQLTDDVIDAELQLLTSNNAASDFVANDSTFRSTFPYFGVKNP